MKRQRISRVPSRALTRHSAILVGQAIICLLIVGAGLLPQPAQTADSVYDISLALTLLIVWSLWSWWRTTRALFDPYGLFMTSLFLFSSGQALLEVVGLNSGGVLAGKFDDMTIVAALYMVLLAVGFTHLGALLAARYGSSLRRPQPSTPVDQQALRVVGWALLALSIVPSTLLLLENVRMALAGGYGALYQREAPTGLDAGPQVAALFLMPAALFLLAGAGGSRREKAASTLIIGVHTLGQLFLGYRSAAIMPICAFLWLWNQCEWRIKPAWILGLGLFVIVVVVPISRETRTLDGLDRIRLETLINSYVSLDNPIVSSVSEMGGSLIAVAYTYVLVPGARTFDYGVGYLYATLTVLPNFFSSVHPAIARGTASDWLIWTVDPYGASRQGGLGYSCIAEAYLNFGWFGVPMVMTSVGFAIAALTFWCRGNRTRLAMAAVITAFLLRFPRDESASLVRALVWYCWLPATAAVLIARMSGRHQYAFRRPSILRAATNHTATAPIRPRLLTW
jgi:oligosaccharide repeat unit polymerase